MLNYVETDAEIERKIRARYGRVISAAADAKNGPELPPIYLSSPGAPLAAWHSKAFLEIDELMRCGASFAAACRTVHAWVKLRPYNVSSISTVKRAYQRFKKEGIWSEFAAAVLTDDIPLAVSLVRRMTPQMRSTKGIL